MTEINKPKEPLSSEHILDFIVLLTRDVAAWLAGVLHSGLYLASMSCKYQELNSASMCMQAPKVILQSYGLNRQSRELIIVYEIQFVYRSPMTMMVSQHQTCVAYTTFLVHPRSQFPTPCDHASWLCISLNFMLSCP